MLEHPSDTEGLERDENPAKKTEREMGNQTGMPQNPSGGSISGRRSDQLCAAQLRCGIRAVLRMTHFSWRRGDCR